MINLTAERGSRGLGGHCAAALGALLAVAGLVALAAADAATAASNAASTATTADNPARLRIPDYGVLADKASDSVNITLDSSMLALAGHFLNANDPEDAATLEIIQGLQGIFVRSFTFDQDHAYDSADIESVRKQLAAPGWSLLMQSRSRKTHEDVEIYIMTLRDKAMGLALIDIEPREFTIVNIVGSIDLQKLHALEGRFGVPKFDIDAASAAPRK